LTVAAVPTGIKAGVFISPLGVEITPHLAFSLTADKEYENFFVIKLFFKIKILFSILFIH
jgi:hypothetical protein